MSPDRIPYHPRPRPSAIQPSVPRIQINGELLNGHFPFHPSPSTSSPNSFFNAEYSDSNDDSVLIDVAAVCLETRDAQEHPGWATGHNSGSYAALPSLSGVGTLHSSLGDASYQELYPVSIPIDLEQSHPHLVPSNLHMTPADNLAFCFPLQSGSKTPSNESDCFSFISHACLECKFKNDQVESLETKLRGLEQQVSEWQHTVRKQHATIKTQQLCIEELEGKLERETNGRHLKRSLSSNEQSVVVAGEFLSQRSGNDTSPAKRGRFAPQQRKQTAETRQRGACIRCWKHKQRCDPGDDIDGPCKSCKEPSLSLTRIPCIRTHIVELSIFRCGTGSNDTWTRRDEVGTPKDLTTYVSNDRKRLVLTHGFGPKLQVNVRLYRPVRDDVTDYVWRDGHGKMRQLPMPPYALSDIDDLTQSMQLYIRDNTDAYIQKFISQHDLPTWKAFQIAKRLVRAEKSEMLRDALQLWTAARLIEKPWQICGEETLGMTTGKHWWWIPVTPIMDTQLDQIVIKSCLLPLKKSVLQKLQTKIEKGFRQSWFEILITIIIILSTIEEATRHDHEFARFFGHEDSRGRRRFEDYKLIESYFHSAMALLTHVKVSFEGRLPYLDNNVDISKLMNVCQDDDEKDYMIETDKYVNDRKRKTEFEKIRNRHQYEAQQFFVHQLFLKDWDGQPIAIKEKEW